MGFRDRKARFLKIKGSCKIVVSRHAFADHPERGFSPHEIKQLVKTGTGRVTENRSPESIKDSFLFYPKDSTERECKLVILLEEIEIEDEYGNSKKESIIVCGAYRDMG